MIISESGKRHLLRVNVVLLFVAAAAIAIWLQAEKPSFLPPFFSRPAGFDISWSLIPFTATDSYGKVFLVGALNTLFLAVTSIIAGTMLGIAIGIARRSPDPAIKVPARIYTAALINTPLILQVLVWYLGVFNRLPSPRDSVQVGDWIALNNRGVFIASPGFSLWLLPVAVIGFLIVRRIACRHLDPRRSGLVNLCAGAITSALVIGALITLPWDKPHLEGFNYTGGRSLPPGLCVILIALILNNAAYVGEIVRSGLAGVPPGQTEAGKALGLGRFVIFRKIVFPQAFRIVIPPLISQAQDVFKNCALAIVVGFPDLVGLWTNIALNQSGRAMEILTTTVLFYLAGGLIVSASLSLYGNGLLRARSP